ncbi:MAG: PEP-CTERM sorting domain-containing protein [Akkermansiaceae bacterium]
MPFSIDPTTGVYTNIGTGAFNVRGMAIDPETGRLYAGNSSNRFFEINLTDGSHTDLGGGIGGVDFDIDGLAFVPEPSSSMLLALSGTMMLMRRRRL